MRALFAWCKFRIVFIPVTDLVVVMQINYYYYHYYYYCTHAQLLYTRLRELTDCIDCV